VSRVQVAAQCPFGAVQGVSSRGVGGSGHGYNSLFQPVGRALKVDKLTFAIRVSDSSWHPVLPGRPLSSVGHAAPVSVSVSCFVFRVSCFVFEGLGLRVEGPATVEKSGNVLVV